MCVQCKVLTEMLSDQKVASDTDRKLNAAEVHSCAVVAETLKRSTVNSKARSQIRLKLDQVRSAHRTHRPRTNVHKRLLPALKWQMVYR